MKPFADKFFITALVLYTLASFIVGGCVKEGPQPAPPYEPAVVVVVADSGVEWDEPTDGPGGAYLVPDCAHACINLRKLGCPDGWHRPGEDTCYVLCKRAQLSTVMDFKPACVAAAKTVEELLMCGTYRCR